MALARAFPLRKLFSNSPDLLVGLNEIDHGLAVEIPLDDSSGFKVLEIFWNTKNDAFFFRISKLPDDEPTKRSLLSAVAKLFDPMGWLCPVMITAKISLQRLWLRKIGWDALLPSDLALEWHDFRLALATLSSVSVPRWTFRGNDTDCESIEIYTRIFRRI